jgi:hypothetical protein
MEMAMWKLMENPEAMSKPGKVNKQNSEAETKLEVTVRLD